MVYKGKGDETLQVKTAMLTHVQFWKCHGLLVPSTQSVPGSRQPIHNRILWRDMGFLAHLFRIVLRGRGKGIPGFYTRSAWPQS